MNSGVKLNPDLRVDVRFALLFLIYYFGKVCSLASHYAAALMLLPEGAEEEYRRKD